MYSGGVLPGSDPADAPFRAQVAESADAPHSKFGVFGRVGSSPTWGTATVASGRLTLTLWAIPAGPGLPAGAAAL